MKIISFLCLFGTCFSYAQLFKRKPLPPIVVDLQHSVRGIENVKMVAFHIHDHQDAELLNRELVSGFLQDGRLKVVGTDVLEGIAAEHGIVPESKLSRGEAAALAGALGPGVVLVDLQILKSDLENIKKGIFSRWDYATRFEFRAKLQVTIPKSGDRLESSLLEVLYDDPGGFGGNNDLTRRNEVLEKGFGIVRREVAALFVPTTQRLELTLFKDKALRIKEAAAAYGAGDLDSALNISLESVAEAEQMGGEDELLGHLYFNAAALHLMIKDDEKAAYFFEKSYDLAPDPITYNALAAVRSLVRYKNYQPIRLQGEEDILINKLRRLKKWHKDQLLDKDEYRRERMSVLETADFGQEASLPEKLSKAKSLYDEKLISEQEYKVLKRKILEVTSY